MCDRGCRFRRGSGANASERPAGSGADVVTFAEPDPDGDGIATADADCVADSGTVICAPGETAQVVLLTVNGDMVAEPPAYLGEWALVRFSNPSPTASLDLSFFGLGVAVIVDDD